MLLLSLSLVAEVVMMAVAFIISSSCCSIEKYLLKVCAQIKMCRYCLHSTRARPLCLRKVLFKLHFTENITIYESKAFNFNVDRYVCSMFGWRAAHSLTSMAALAEQRGRIETQSEPPSAVLGRWWPRFTLHSINSDCNYFSLSFSQHITCNRKVLLWIFRVVITLLWLHIIVCARASFCLMSDSLMIRCNRLGSMLFGAHWE